MNACWRAVVIYFSCPDLLFDGVVHVPVAQPHSLDDLCMVHMVGREHVKGRGRSLLINYHTNCLTFCDSKESSGKVRCPTFRKCHGHCLRIPCISINSEGQNFNIWQSHDFSATMGLYVLAVAYRDLRILQWYSLPQILVGESVNRL